MERITAERGMVKIGLPACNSDQGLVTSRLKAALEQGDDLAETGPSAWTDKPQTSDPFYRLPRARTFRGLQRSVTNL